MEAISINVVSTETVKPRHLHLPDQPFHLTLRDQLAPFTYVSFAFFYLPVQNDQNTLTFETRLRTSLSDTLSRFHPLSGRLWTDPPSIVDFDRGVPFRNALVNCRLSEFLRNRDGAVMSCLNRFFPFRPYCNEKSKSTGDMPMLAVQVSIVIEPLMQVSRFSCGGVAVGVSLHHTIVDAATLASFIDGWAAITRGESSAVGDRDMNLDGGSLRVHGMASMGGTIDDNRWARGGTERFVFDEEALEALKSKARSDVVPNPTRVQAVSGLIWRSVIDATRAVSSGSSSNIHVMTHVVNMRPRKQSNNGRPTTGTVVGNSVMSAAAVYNNIPETNTKNPKLPELVKLVSDSISEVNDNLARSVRGTEALDSLLIENLKAMEGLFSCEDLEIVSFTSLVNMGFKDFDFGLGKPVWVGVRGREGDGGPELTKLVILNDATWCKGIEVWVNLDEKVVEFMRNDPEFLEFAVVDPPIPFYQM